MKTIEQSLQLALRELERATLKVQDCALEAERDPHCARKGVLLAKSVKTCAKRQAQVDSLAAQADLAALEIAREGALDTFREKGRSFGDGSAEEIALDKACAALNAALAAQGESL